MRTGKSRKNRSNKDVAVVSNKSGMQGRLLRLLDRVLDGATGWSGPSAFSLEQLEPRVMLSDSTLAAAGQYSLYDSSTAHATTKADIVVLNSVAGGATVGVNVTDGGSAGVADTIDLVINDPDASAAENLTVNLVSTGPIHSITFNGSAGDTLTLSVTIATITEGADAAHLTGGVTFTTAALEDTGKFQDTDTLTTTTFAANGSIGATALSGISGGSTAYTVNGGGSVGSVTISGGVDLSVASGTNLTIGGSPDVVITGDVTLGSHTLTVNLPDTGTASIGVGSTIAINGAGNLAVAGAANIGAVSFGDVTTGAASAGGLSVTPAAGDNLGDLSFGSVALSSSNGGATISATLTGSATLGAVDFAGAVTLSGPGGIGIDNGGATGAIGAVSFEQPITLASTSTGGVAVGNTSAASMGAISLSDLTMAAGSTGSLALEAGSLDSVTVGSTWTLAGGGNVILDASTGAIGDVGPANGDTWDFDFVDGNSTTVYIEAADGIGTVTFSSVDYGNSLDGAFHIDADTDGGTEVTSGTQVGTIGDFTITTQGDNLLADGTTAIGTNDTEFIGTVNALTGGIISFGGGVFDSTFTAANQNSIAHTGGPGVWGDLSFGGSVTDSTFDAQDGIGAITVTGTDAVFNDNTVNANTDTGVELTTGGGSLSDVVGSLGSVSVSGSAGSDSMTDDSFRGVSLGGFTLSNGIMDIDAETNVTGAVARAAVTTSTIGAVMVTTNGSTTAGGAIDGGTFIADDGIGAFTIQNLTPNNAFAAITTIYSDADGTAAIATTAGNGGGYGGTFGGLTAQGDVSIGTLRTHETGDTTYRASQTSGDIQAGGDTSGDGLSITTVEVGGDLPNITVVETPATAGTNPINITTLDVNGSVNNIATSLVAGDDIFITGGTIGKDLNTINAGAANVQLSLNVLAGTSGSPVFMITDTGVDYILDISGTWSAGTNPATINTTLTFAGGNVNSVTINDLEGTTSAADTVLQIATRADPMGTNTLATYAGGLGTDTSAASFNLAGFQDSYGAGRDGRHSFNEVLIEGDLTGSIGNDPNPSDGTVQTLASNAPILGTIHNLEIEGEWHNSTAKIFVMGLGDLSFGSLEVDRDTVTPGSQFSFDSTSGQSTNDNNPPVTASSIGGGNSNGTTEDLEVYSAFASISGTSVVLTIPTSGSLTKTFIGPTGSFETIRFTNNSPSVTGNVVIEFGTGGVIDDLYLFGEQLGVEYQALDNSNPATTSSTNIHYGQADPNQPSLAPTEPSAPGNNAIDFLEFSSPIGNITVVDINSPVLGTPNNIPASVGNVLVGYVVNENGVSDVQSLRSYINNPNRSGTGQTVPVSGTAPATTIQYAGAGNISVDGSLGEVVTSGGVGTITTNDTVTELAPVPSANFAGLVTDGSAGAIDINGNVAGSLVVGDAVVTSLGTDGLLSTADDSVGILNQTIFPALADATPLFDGDIAVTGNLGTTARYVLTSTTALPTGPNGEHIQAPTDNGDTYALTFLDTAETSPSLAGELTNLGNGYDRDQVSAPDGIGVNIVVGGTIKTAIVSGKHILVDQTEDQTDDSITGNIIAGQTATTTTAGDNAIGVVSGVTSYALVGGTNAKTGGNINGDIWSGESIGAPGGGTVIEAFAKDVAGVYVSGGSISSANINDSVLVYASGGSAGDITSNILADADIVNIHIIAGSGSGGSLLANVVAGLDPLYNLGTGGSIIEDGDTNEIFADNSIGSPSFTNVISSAGSMTWDDVESGQITSADFGSATDEGQYGINSDFSAGVVLNTDTTSSTLPLQANINDTGGRFDPTAPAGGLPLYTNTSAGISISTLEADYNSTTSSGFDSGVSLLDGTLVAAGSISIGTLNVAGDATGNDGAAGGHIAAAGLGNKDTSFSDQNELSIGGGTIAGVLYGTFSAGLFVPADQTTGSPLNVNDTGPLRAGTVLSSGAVDISLDLGAWDQSHTGTAGTDGISLPDLISGTESGVVAGYIPAFSIGATCNIELDIDVIGLPFVAPQTGPGNVPVVASTGNASDVSIAAFGSVDGGVTIAGTAGFNLVLSNIDAITAFDGASDGSVVGGSGHVVNPSAPSTLTPLQSGSIVGTPNPGNVAASLGIDNNLNITSNGNGAGGLDIEYYLAGLDYFVQLPVTASTPTGYAPDAFWSSFGYGSIGTTNRHPTLAAFDANPTNGFGAGNLTFALIAAGQDEKATLIADNNIIAHLGGATTDGSLKADGNPLIPADAGTGFDADIVAGLDADAALSPLGQIGSFFSGGNITGNITAGNNISSASNPNSEITIAAIGNSAASPSTGNISSNITSGTNPLFDNGNTASNINAFIIAGNSYTGTIDAGNNLNFGGDNAGIFTGGVWAGAGVDLDINTTADNSIGGSIANILTGGDLNSIQGIYSQGTIGVIEVGFGVNGGDLHGNVVAQNDIMEIQVFGDIGGNYNPADGSNTPDATPGDIFTGGVIDALGVGNDSAIPGDVGGSVGQFARLLHSPDVYINTFGTVYDAIYMGFQEPGGSPAPTPTIDVVAFGGTGMIVNGGGVGVSTFTYNHNGQITTYTFSGSDNLGIFTIGANGVDIYAYDTGTVPPGSNGGTPIALTVIGPAGIDRLVAVEGLGSLEVVGGSVNQIIVDNSFDVLTAITGPVGPGQLIDLTLFPFLTDSLLATPPVTSVGNFVNTIKVPIDVGIINVQGHIGTTATLTGGITTKPTTSALATADNVAIYIAGNLLGSITSETDSVGNVYIGGELSEEELAITGATGSTFTVSGDETSLFTAGRTFEVTGSSAPDNNGVFTVSSSAFASGTTTITLTTSVDTTGASGEIIISGDTTISARVNVGDVYIELGSVGSGNHFNASTGSIGVISTEDDIVYPGLNARTNLGGLVARTGSLLADADVDGSIGLLEASGNIIGNFTAETGSIGDDLDTTDIFNAVTTDANFKRSSTGTTVSYGIFSDAGNIGGPGPSTTVTTIPFSGVNNTAIFNEPNVLTGSGAFVGFNVGDVVTISPSSDPAVVPGLYTIIQKSNDSRIVLDRSPTLSGETATDLAGFDSVSTVTPSLALSLTAGTDIGNTGAYLGSVDGSYLAGNSVGNVSAGANIDGSYTAERGTIGSLLALTGSIGAAVPVSLTATGGLTIDPATLQYSPAPSSINGIGDVFAILGNIDVAVQTAASLGVFQAGTPADGSTPGLIGGIAAPAGSVTVTGFVGGDLGGVSGATVDQTNLTVNGVRGIVRNDSNNPGVTTITRTLTITTGGTATLTLPDGDSVTITGTTGSATVAYSLDAAGNVTDIDSILFNSDGSATSGVTVSSPAATGVDVESLTVHGNVNTISVQGSVDTLEVDGNLGLSNGHLTVTGDLGDVGGAIVTGNIGTGPAPAGTVGAANLTVKVGGFFSGFTGETNGTNFGLQTFSIDSVASTSAPQLLTFANPNDNPSITGDETIDLYIGSGSATVTLDNGFIQNIVFGGTSATNFIVMESHVAMTPAQLAAQPNLIVKNLPGTATLPNLFGDTTTVANTGTNGNSLVKSISASGGKFTLKGLFIEGAVDDITLPGNASTIVIDGDLTDKITLGGTLNGLTTEGNLGGIGTPDDLDDLLSATGGLTAKSGSNINVGGSAANLLASLGLKNLNIAKDAELIDGGTTVSNLVIGGDAGVIKASKTVSNVRVTGNAGIVSSGGSMSGVVIGGSSISIGAATMKNVDVAGSLGASFQHGTDTLDLSGNGDFYTSAGVADLLNINQDRIGYEGNPGAADSYLPPGPGAEDSSAGYTVDIPYEVFYGGLEARVASNVVVAGPISDTVILNWSGSDSIVNDTVDDAYVKVGRKTVTKVNGSTATVVIDPTTIVIAGVQVERVTL